VVDTGTVGEEESGTGVAVEPVTNVSAFELDKDVGVTDSWSSDFAGVPLVPLGDDSFSLVPLLEANDTATSSDCCCSSPMTGFSRASDCSTWSLY